ncbi:MAG: hypothetical protein V4858_18605 [Pseudomonadota bacterium]
MFGTLGALPIDYLHTTEFDAWRPAFGEHGPSLAALARRHVSVPVLANGSLHEARQADGMVARHEADLVSLGRGALTHADWPARLRAGEGDAISTMPPPDRMLLIICMVLFLKCIGPFGHFSIQSTHAKCLEEKSDCDDPY